MSDAGRKIIEGIKEAIRGNFASVTVDGQRWGPLPDWQPIETAPKDGTRILAWTKDWLAPLTVAYYGTRWSYNYDAVLRHQPTHWMPLPTPPETET